MELSNLGFSLDPTSGVTGMGSGCGMAVMEDADFKSDVSLDVAGDRFDVKEVSFVVAGVNTVVEDAAAGRVGSDAFDAVVISAVVTASVEGGSAEVEISEDSDVVCDRGGGVSISVRLEDESPYQSA